MTDEPTIEARQKLIAAMYRCRYAAGIMRYPDLLDEEPTFLTDITDWINTLNEHLATVSTITTDMQNELTQFRKQQKAVRDFLGLTTTEKGPA